MFSFVINSTYACPNHAPQVSLYYFISGFFFACFTGQRAYAILFILQPHTYNLSLSLLYYFLHFVSLTGGEKYVLFLFIQIFVFLCVSIIPLFVHSLHCVCCVCVTKTLYFIYYTTNRRWKKPKITYPAWSITKSNWISVFELTSL